MKPELIVRASATGRGPTLRAVSGTSRDLFARDERGRTVLFDLAQRGAMHEVEQIIFSLVGTGFAPQRLAFIEIKDHDGLTAADVAESHGHGEVAALLRHERDRMEMFE